MTLIGMMFLLMVVKSDEDVDGYGDGAGDGDSRNPAHRADILATHLQPLPPYYFILTAHNLAPNASHP